jgi:hypothetical protein
MTDGRHLIVKRFSPETDLLMAVLGDVVGREFLLWSRGILDLLDGARSCGHASRTTWTGGFIRPVDAGRWTLVRCGVRHVDWATLEVGTSEVGMSEARTSHWRVTWSS